MKKNLIVPLTLFLGLYLGYYFIFYAPQQAHERAKNRILAVIHRGDSSPPPGIDANSWHNYLGAPHNAVYNLFVMPKYFPTAKLEVLAAQFEAKWPQGPKTTQDVLGMVEVMSAANPARADYGPFQDVRQWVKEEKNSVPSH